MLSVESKFYCFDRGLYNNTTITMIKEILIVNTVLTVPTVICLIRNTLKTTDHFPYIYSFNPIRSI